MLEVDVDALADQAAVLARAGRTFGELGALATGAGTTATGSAGDPALVTAAEGLAAELRTAHRAAAQVLAALGDAVAAAGTRYTTVDQQVADTAG